MKYLSSFFWRRFEAEFDRHDDEMKLPSLRIESEGAVALLFSDQGVSFDQRFEDDPRHHHDDGLPVKKTSISICLGWEDNDKREQNYRVPLFSAFLAFCVLLFVLLLSCFCVLLVFLAPNFAFCLLSFVFLLAFSHKFACISCPFLLFAFCVLRFAFLVMLEEERARGLHVWYDSSSNSYSRRTMEGARLRRTHVWSDPIRSGWWSISRRITFLHAFLDLWLMTNPLSASSCYHYHGMYLHNTHIASWHAPILRTM